MDEWLRRFLVGKKAQFQKYRKEYLLGVAQDLMPPGMRGVPDPDRDLPAYPDHESARLPIIVLPRSKEERT